uniref:SWIM-type domain-containing protein n=1 Tax=Arundo donax TaxID=35708 RepID=A0A0A9DSX2_ARUDO
MQNFIKRWSGDSFGQMWPAARAYRNEVFEKIMAEIFTAAPDVWPWIRDHHSLKWMRCAFNPDIKCNHITNNLAEVFNNWAKDIKDLPVVDLVDKLREMIMVLWRKRRRIGERLHGKILPAIMVQLKARTRRLGYLRVVSSANWSAEVHDNGIRHIVKLRIKECTCLAWQHTGKLCEHALAFLTTQKNVQLEEFVHEFYSVDKFRAAYERVIEPMIDKTQWPKVDKWSEVQLLVQGVA